MDIEQKLIIAIKNDNLSVVKYLVFEDPSIVNCTAMYFEKPIHVACIYKKLKILKFLVSEGGNINSRGYSGNTPLHVASSIDNNVEILEYLISLGCDLKIKNDDNKTPIQISTVENIKYFLSRGINCDISFLKNSHQQEIMDFLATPKIYQEKKKKTLTLEDLSRDLVKAAKKCDLDLIRFLVDNGANVNVRNDDGCTPLHFACESGEIDIVEYLVFKGADLEVETFEETPLFKAVSQGHSKVVKYLIDNGANIDVRDAYSGCTLLQKAQMSYNEVIIEMIEDKLKEKKEKELENLLLKKADFEFIQKWCKNQGYIIGKKI